MTCVEKVKDLILKKAFYFCKICPVYTTAYKEKKAKSRTLKLADVNVKIDVTFGVTSILRNVFAFLQSRFKHKITYLLVFKDWIIPF